MDEERRNPAQGSGEPEDSSSQGSRASQEDSYSSPQNNTQEPAQYGQSQSGAQGADYDQRQSDAPAQGGQYGQASSGAYRPQYGQQYSQAGYQAPYQPSYVSAPAPVKSKKRGPGWLALIVAMILTAALTMLGTIGLVSAGLLSASSKTNEPAPEQPTTGKKTQVVETEGSATNWQAVADAVRPATVTINVRTQNGGDTGSGVIWDTKGNIVTNYHVVAAGQNGGQITVSMNDGRLYEAEIVGLDSTTDLAVIKLVNPPDNLVAANFGDSSDLTVGQNVMAIGSPLGLSDTVTTGIISALDRPVAVKTAVPKDQQEDFNYQFPFFQQQEQSETVITNAIQVDASINPGNSGGPLFDQKGRVIGINSSIASMGSAESSSGSIGLGFAIPVNLVKNVTVQLIETGRAEHAQLGVTISSAAVTVDGVTRVGAEVVSILPDGAAAGADIQKGDVILSIDGHEVVSSRSLTGFVRRYNSGDEVTLEIARGGTKHEVQVVLKAK